MASEYLTLLQHRPKWYSRQAAWTSPFGERGPPLKWAIAEVENLHAGNDGHSQVATVQTTNGHSTVSVLIVFDITPQPPINYRIMGLQDHELCIKGNDTEGGVS